MSEPLVVSSFTRKMVDFIVGRPVLSMLLGLALVGAGTAGVRFAHADFTHKAYFWDDDPHLIRFDAFERRFGNDDAVVVAIHSPSGIFDLDSAALLREATQRMWNVPEVIRVDSLSNYNWVHARGDDIIVEPLLPEQLTPALLEERKRVALAHEVIPDYLVSRDGRTALIFARIKPGIDRPPDAPVITRAVETAVADLRRGDHLVYIAGGPPLTNAFAEVATADVSRLFPLAILVAALFLYLILRSLAGVLLPLAVVFLSIGATFGFAGWTGITLTNMSTVIPSIMIAVAVADSVHILHAFLRAHQHRPGQQSRRQGRREAARYALEKNMLPTFLTSSTTAIGFITFLSANLKPLSGMGVMAAFGTMLAWVLSYLFLGALLVLLPLKPRSLPPEAQPLSERLSGRYTAFLVRNRRKVMAGAALAAVVSLALSATNQVNSDPLKYFREHIPVRVANHFIEEKVGSARGVEVVIDAGSEDGVKDPAFLRKAEALQAWVEKQPGITRALSVVDVIKQMNRSLNGDAAEAYRIPDDRQTVGQELFLYTMNLPQGMDLNDRVTLKNDALRMTVLTRISTSREIMALVARIEAQARALGLQAHGTGKFILYNAINGYVVSSFVTSFGQSVLLIGLMMVIFLRSVKLGIIAMIPNVLPVLIGGGFLKLIGQPLDIGTVLVASVCLGIAVDDTIHVLANFQRLRRQGRNDFEAIREVFAHTAPALVSTTAILVLTFATFVAADFTPNVYFGLMTAIILATALLVDMTLTPVLLVKEVPEGALSPGPGAAHGQQAPRTVAEVA
jgi:predicted RND superfamily exporter protein